jgi:hypothetical protein
MRLAIGDIHGRDFWKNYLDEDFTEFYILGDYFDSFNIPFARQYRNFREICTEAGRDSRIKLCLGNHDYHYLRGVTEKYSGFQDRYYFNIQDILEENIDLLKVVFVTPDKYIISHAGVSRSFMRKMKALGVKTIGEINEAFHKNRKILFFDGRDNSGDDVSQSPLWIRPRSLNSEPAAGYNQITGHTPVHEITEVAAHTSKKTTVKIIYTDTGDTQTICKF